MLLLLLEGPGKSPQEMSPFSSLSGGIQMCAMCAVS
jgi:hypothetical protein